MNPLINIEVPRVKAFTKPMVVATHERWTIEVSRKSGIPIFTVPEFGFCEVCQSFDADIAKSNTDFIDFHSEKMKCLYMGTCENCLALALTNEIMCFTTSGGKIQRYWMPMQTRN